MNPEVWKEAERLFRECADMPGSTRNAFLDDACENQPELRNAIDGLLRGDSNSDQRVRQAIGRAAADLSDKRVDRWEGTEIGPYRIDRRIAEGGMGVVYLAHRSDKQFDQQVAIKILATSLASESLRTRFLSERQILANLNHTNIANLLDGGQTDEGMPYLVMQYIDGVPIDQYCDVHKLTVDERLALFIQVCAAVHDAHTNLVIHRDIKPANILVPKDGVPKLLDFGIAKLLDLRDMPHNVAATMDGARLLTPRHASPEQVVGDPITTASDVYSLGLLLYELLCGSFPYAITSATRTSEIEETVTRLIPKAPSVRIANDPNADVVAGSHGSSAASLQKTLRGDLDTIVMKALRKEPASRYSSALALAEDLKRFTEKKPVLARPVTRAYLLSRYWMRHRTAAIGVVATLLAIVLGTTAATIGFFEAREAERVAIIEAQNSAAISDFLVSIFQEAHPDVSAGNERSVREILQLGLDRVDTELDQSPIVKAQVLETLSSVYKGLSDMPQAISLLERAIELLTKSAPDDLESLARNLNDLGDLYRIQSRREDAANLIEKSVALYNTMGDPLTDDRADAVSNLGLVYQEMGRLSEAGELLLEALQMRQQLYAAPHAKIALSLHNLGWHYGRTGDMALAERYTRGAIQMRIELYGEIHPRVGVTLSMLARFYRQQNKWEEAETAARRSVRIAEQIFDGGHPDLTFPLYELAAVLNEEGKIGEARQLLEQIVAWERVSLGPGSHDFGMSLNAYGAVLVDLAEYEQAEVVLREAHGLFLRLPASVRGLDSARTLLGRVLVRTDRPQEAAEILGVVDGMLPETGDDGSTLTRHMEIVEMFLSQDQFLPAEALITDLRAGIDSTSSYQVYLLPRLLSLQGKVLLAIGHSGEAIELSEQAMEIHADRGQQNHWRVAVLRAQLGQAMMDDGRADAGLAQLEHAEPELIDLLGPEHPESRRATAALLQLRQTN
jgi:eukaryotic-like serine/threonine-protein kinase